MKKLILLLWAVASTAYATPPDMISLYDRVIGYSDTQLFILRKTNDNLGLYIYGMHDVFLVAKSLETGVDEEIWPVYRVHSASESTPETQIFALEGAVNPFEILAAALAQFSNRDFRDPNLIRSDEAVNEISEVNIRGIATKPEALMAQIAQSITITSAATQPYPEGDDVNMSFTSPQALLASMEYSMQDCRIDGVDTLFRYPRSNIPLARLNCEDENGQQIWLVVLLSSEPKRR